MKKIVVTLLSLLIILPLIATTFNTPVLDGNITSDWDADEVFEIVTYSDATYTLYITWDEDNLYVGIDRVDGDVDNRYLGDNPGDLSFFVAIDTDQTPGSGANADGYNRVTFSASYLPEYVFYFAGGAGWGEWSSWNGTAWEWNPWTDTWGYYGWDNPGNYDDELAIDWTAHLFDPTGIVVKAWITEEADSYVFGSWPFENQIGTQPDLPWGYQFYEPHMEPVNGPQPYPGVSPNLTEHSLPVELSSFSASFVNNSLTLNWQTQSETNNDGWNVYRAASNDFQYAEKLNSNGIIEGAGTTTQPEEYTFRDESDLTENEEYWYWIESISYSGDSELYGSVSIVIPEQQDNPEAPPTIENYGLFQNYPNPFNPDTEISFNLENDSSVELNIFNMKGELIKTLYQGYVQAENINKFNWDGTNSQGKPVSSGIYFYKLETDTKTYMRKMVLLK